MPRNNKFAKCGWIIMLVNNIILYMLISRFKMSETPCFEVFAKHKINKKLGRPNYQKSLLICVTFWFLIEISSLEGLCCYHYFVGVIACIRCLSMRWNINHRLYLNIYILIIFVIHSLNCFCIVTHPFYDAMQPNFQFLAPVLTIF